MKVIASDYTGTGRTFFIVLEPGDDAFDLAHELVEYARGYLSTGLWQDIEELHSIILDIDAVLALNHDTESDKLDAMIDCAYHNFFGVTIRDIKNSEEDK